MNYHTCKDPDNCRYTYPVGESLFLDFKRICLECEKPLNKKTLCPSCTHYKKDEIENALNRKNESKLCNKCSTIEYEEEIEKINQYHSKSLCDNCFFISKEWIREKPQIQRCDQLIYVPLLLCKDCCNIATEDLKYIKKNYPK